MFFQKLWYRICRLIAWTGLIKAPRPPFYRYAARHRGKLLTKDYSGGLTYAEARQRHT